MKYLCNQHNYHHVKLIDDCQQILDVFADRGCGMTKEGKWKGQ